MVRKSIFTTLILVGLVVFAIAEDCFAGAAAELAQAKKYRQMAFYEVLNNQKSTYYGQTEQMYKSIVQNYQDTDTALQAQRDLVTLYILLERPVDRQAALNKLKSDFATHPKLPAALHIIARRNESPENPASDKYQVSKSIYQYLINHYPSSTSASKAPLDILRGQTFSFIDAGNDTAAEATIDKMITDFAGHPRLAATLYSTANMKKFEALGKYGPQSRLYQKIVQHCAGSKYADKAKLDIHRLNIAQLIQAGDSTAAETQLNSLIADFPRAVHLADVVAMSAQEYYNQGMKYERQGLDTQAMTYFEKAAATCEKVTLEQAKEENVTEHSYYFWGDCCRKLGRYAESIQHYQKLADDYPDYRMAWDALFMVGRNYQKMAKEGLIAKSEAKASTTAAYQQLIESYPDCMAAKAAQRWLNRNTPR